MPKSVESKKPTKHTYVETTVTMIFPNGQEVEVRRKDAFVLAFGDTHARGVTLKGFGACLGFFNAIMDIQDERYKVLEYGLHLTEDPLTFMDLYKADGVGHIAFDLLSDENQKKYKAMKPVSTDPLSWHIVNVRKGRIALGPEVDPMIADDFKAEFGEDPHQLAIEKNQTNWRRFFKQEGLELAQRVLKGAVRVTLVLNPREGFDGEIVAWEKKIAQLSMEADPRAEARAESIAQAQSRRSGRVGTYLVKNNEDFAAEAEAAAPKGDEGEKIIQSLIGKTVVFVEGDYTHPGDQYCPDREAVLNAFLDAQKKGENCIVVPVEK